MAVSFQCMTKSTTNKKKIKKKINKDKQSSLPGTQLEKIALGLNPDLLGSNLCVFPSHKMILFISLFFLIHFLILPLLPFLFSLFCFICAN